MNRNEWLAFLRSNDSEAKELLALHPGMKPPDESTWREAMKALWKDPGFRARNAAAARENWKDPGFRARHAAAVREVLKERWKDPGFRARNAAAVRENWKDPGFRARNAAAVSAAQVRRWAVWRHQRKGDRTSGEKP